VHSLDAGLSANVMEQSQLSEIVALLVLVNHSWELIMGLFLLSNQIALQNNVKLVSAFALINDELAVFELFFLQYVIKLFPEIKLKSTFPAN
jgi:hypothetical protein